MKFFYLAAAFLFTTISGFSQKEFFSSKQTFTASQLNNFYSSVTVNGDLLLFIANDYKLYAYDKSTGEQKWATSLSYKTKTTCFVADDIVYSPYSDDGQECTAQLDRATGKLIKKLPVGPLQTKPMIQNGVLFGTAIYDGGCLFAYDTKADSLLWWKFLAHGVSTQPYFFSNYIQGNAEGNNWFTINYKGQLTDTACKGKADIFVNDIPCIKEFGALTHDRLALDEKISKKIFNDEEAITTENTLAAGQHSFVLHDDKLVVIGNKRKIKKQVDLFSLLPDSVQENSPGLSQLLGANEETVSFVYYNQFIVYNFKQEKIERQLDLTSFDPYQVLSEQDKLWVISKKDGLLYGLSF